MKNTNKTLITFIVSSVVCILGIVCACMKNTDVFHFKAFGITVAIIAGLYSLISFLVYLGLLISTNKY